MTLRTTTSTVRFSRPFVLAAVDDTQPAGTYTVETDEELLQAASLSAYRRVSTLIRLPPRPGSNELARVVDIDPLELSTLLASDAALEKTPPSLGPTIALPPANPAAARIAPKGPHVIWRSWLALNANELTWIALLGGGVLFAALLADR
jgi:hypothetical protein